MRNTINWPDAARHAAFDQWMASVARPHGLDAGTLEPASADASFRRYLRVQGDAGPLIVMDAPPPQEDVRPFVRVAGLIADAGLNAPRVLASDAEQGFLLLTDLGHTLYLKALQDADGAQADRLMRDLLQTLVQWQLKVPAEDLPPYDEALLARELALFPEWCMGQEFGLHWGREEHQVWDNICRVLIDSALAQPQLAVHRDFMPRNLMLCEGGPGILDFQDAVRGPITYDLASLLRDAFITWNDERELDWAVRYWEMARDANLPLGNPMRRDFGEFWRALEWMGLQRHLKILGIFCRLKHRDGKPAYARDLTRFFGYATRVAHRYGPLRPLIRLLEPLSGPLVSQGVTF